MANWFDLDEVINTLLAGSAEQRKRIAELEERLRDLERQQAKRDVK